MITLQKQSRFWSNGSAVCQNSPSQIRKPNFKIFSSGRRKFVTSFPLECDECLIMSQNDIFVASVAHHIGAYNVVTSLFLCSSWFEVRSLDHRSYRTWTTKLGLIHVAAMYFKANAAADEKSFWGALARSVELKELETMQSKRRTMINVEVTVASTQHIHHFPLVKNSASQESYLLHQVWTY